MNVRYTEVKLKPAVLYMSVVSLAEAVEGGRDSGFKVGEGRGVS
jgi:hypothetical protein